MAIFKRQISVYYFFSFFNRFMIYYPVFVIFLNKVGFSQTKIMLLMAVYNLSIFFSEIPTGVIADRYSRKLSVLIGCVIQGISMLCMLLTENFIWFILIEIFFGIGITFQSGAQTALLYDYLDFINKKEEFPKIEGRKWAFTFSAQGIAAIIGGILANYNIESTILLTSIFYIISSFIIALFKEYNFHPTFSTKYLPHVRQSLTIIISKKKVFSLFLIIIFTESLLSTTLWLYQPYFQNINIPISFFGIVYFAQFAFRAYGGSISGKLNFNLIHVVQQYTLTPIIGTILMGFSTSPIGIIFPIIIFYTCGKTQPWIQKYWEDHLPSDKRATIDSFLSLSSSLIFSIISIPLGIVSDYFGTFNALKVSSIFLGLIILATYTYIIRKRVFE